MKVLTLVLLLTVIVNIERGSCAPTPTVLTRMRQRSSNCLSVKNGASETGPKVIGFSTDRTSTERNEKTETTTSDSLEVEDFINPNCVLSLCGG